MIVFPAWTRDARPNKWDQDSLNTVQSAPERKTEIVASRQRIDALTLG
jgi:hypothetical protein